MEKGFIDVVIAELGYEGDDGPRRRQVQNKLRYEKHAVKTHVGRVGDLRGFPKPPARGQGWLTVLAGSSLWEPT